MGRVRPGAGSPPPEHASGGGAPAWPGTVVPEPALALAFGAEEWVEALHHHLIHRGGARVQRVVVDPDELGGPDYDVLVASYRWPGLTAGLIDALHAAGAWVLGVSDPAVAASVPILGELGVDAIAGSDERPEVLVALTADLARRGRAVPSPRSAALRATRDRGAIRPARVVVGGPAGAGATEVAIGVAEALASRAVREGEPAGVLVDLDLDLELGSGGLACRLALGPQPHLGNLVEAVEHARRRPECLQAVGPGLDALVAPPAAAGVLRAPEVARAVAATAATHGFVVCDVGAATGAGPDAPGGPVARRVIADADLILAVGDASPAGLGALRRWIVGMHALAPGVPCLAVVNRMARGHAYASRVEALAWPPSVVAVRSVPHDARLARAAWMGGHARHGPFARAMRRLTASITRSASAPTGREAAVARRRDATMRA